MRAITGFHAIEERIRRGGASGAPRYTRFPSGNTHSVTLTLLYGKAGPRVKRIIALCHDSGVLCKEASAQELDAAVKSLPQALRDHRGVVLLDDGSSSEQGNIVDFDEWLALLPPADEDALSGSSSDFAATCATALDKIVSRRHIGDSASRCTVVILDGITDEHNVGAIIRSCDQFGASLVVLPERRGAGGAGDVDSNAVIARASAGASSWVNIAVVKNLSRTVKALKDAGFWVYRADARGQRCDQTGFAPRTALVMGSEGSGVRRLVAENCDQTVAIPTCGRIDSLNVSVAAGVLLYEIQRQWTEKASAPVIASDSEATSTGGQ